MGQFQCVPTTYATETKESYLEIYTYQVSCPLSQYLKHPKLSISIKIHVTLLQIVYILHDSYISKLEFMNYLFANLVVAWLYFYQSLEWLESCTYCNGPDKPPKKNVKL